MKKVETIAIILVALLGIFIWRSSQAPVAKIEPVANFEISEYEFETIGYYGPREINYYGIEATTSEEYTCDSFYILDGDQRVIKYFKEMVSRGNLVNEINSRGELGINLDMHSLSDFEVQKIKSSSRLSPITLGLKKLSQYGKGAPPCYSFFKILEVK